MCSVVNQIGIASIGTASMRIASIGIGIASIVIASRAGKLFPRNALFSKRAEDARWTLCPGMTSIGID